MQRRLISGQAWVLLVSAILLAPHAAVAADYDFHVSFSADVRKEPYTGRV